MPLWFTNWILHREFKPNEWKAKNYFVFKIQRHRLGYLWYQHTAHSIKQMLSSFCENIILYFEKYFRLFGFVSVGFFFFSLAVRECLCVWVSVCVCICLVAHKYCVHLLPMFYIGKKKVHIQCISSFFAWLNSVALYGIWMVDLWIHRFRKWKPEHEKLLVFFFFFKQIQKAEC